MCIKKLFAITGTACHVWKTKYSVFNQRFNDTFLETYHKHLTPLMSQNTQLKVSGVDKCCPKVADEGAYLI